MKYTFSWFFPRRRIPERRLLPAFQADSLPSVLTPLEKNAGLSSHLHVASPGRNPFANLPFIFRPFTFFFVFFLSSFRDFLKKLGPPMPIDVHGCHVLFLPFFSPCSSHRPDDGVPRFFLILRFFCSALEMAPVIRLFKPHYGAGMA